MRILIVSGYHGGSHRAWADGYKKYSKHQVNLLTLPARFWKWRMHGGAVTLARRFLERIRTGDLRMPDLLLFTDMVDASTFLALIRRQCPTLPAALYMHENQLTYPLPESPEGGPMRRQKGERDLHYVFVNFASMLAVDRVYFNSRHHRDDFLETLPSYLRHFPEFNELGQMPGLEDKSRVLYVGIDGEYLGRLRPEKFEDVSPLIVWNQRWEFDKNPKQFFDALITLAREGIAFKLAVCGERFSRQPPEFVAAKAALDDRIIHWGYANRVTYRRLLWRSTITASTALHEFFGISMLEAMYCQTHALLPNRLSYPELLPKEFYNNCFYDSPDQLVAKLRWALLNPELAQHIGKALSRAVSKFDWRTVAPGYDGEFEGLA